MGKRALGFLCIVAAATAFSGSGHQAWRPYSSSRGPHPGRPECPHDWDFKAGQMAEIGPYISVPEFHDCQRLIKYVNDTAKYDSLYAIFAATNLRAIDSAFKYADSGHTGEFGVVGAEIYAEGVFPELGIMSTFNCLYLFRLHTWRAVMVPQGQRETNCRRVRHINETGGKELEVQPETAADFKEPDVPPVARWDWDEEHHQQIIGIKCGDMWCNVGPRGFTSLPPRPLPTNVPYKRRRTHMIKGWFDGQYLADTNAAGEIVPSKIWGLIYPDPALDDDDTVNAFRRGVWVPAAEVELQDRSGAANPTNPYKKSLNLDFTTPGGHANLIFLCHGTKAECKPNLTRVCDGDGQWWGMVRSVAAGPALYMCNVRRAHDELKDHVPGTARWRWLAGDETTWKRCDNGCCELH